MSLTPDDIVGYPLHQSLRGYSVKEVDELLDRVADELERLHRELEETRRRAERAENRAADAGEMESTLKRTLLTAQHTADRTVTEAQKRAEQILSQAQQEAENIRAAAEETAVERQHALRNEEAELRERVAQLRSFEKTYRSSLKGLAERHLKELDDETKQLAKPAAFADQGSGQESETGRLTEDTAGAEGAPGGESASAAAHRSGDHEASPPTSSRQRSSRHDSSSSPRGQQSS